MYSFCPKNDIVHLNSDAFRFSKKSVVSGECFHYLISIVAFGGRGVTVSADIIRGGGQIGKRGGREKGENILKR
jgi:hypothetical protein